MWLCSTPLQNLCLLSRVPHSCAVTGRTMGAIALNRWRNDMSIKALQEAVAYATLQHNYVMAAALQAALDRLTRTK